MASNHFTLKLINLIFICCTVLTYPCFFLMFPGKNLKNYSNFYLKLKADFHLPDEAYPLPYLIYRIAGGDYDVALKMILEGKYTLLKYLNFATRSWSRRKEKRK